MERFMIHFLFCSLLLCGIIGIFFFLRTVFKTLLVGRMRYHLWLVLLILSAIPFLPGLPFKFSGNILWSFLPSNHSFSFHAVSGTGQNMQPYVAAAGWMNDFTESVTQRTPSSLWGFLFAVWIAGVLFMGIFLIRSALRLHALKNASLPLQHEKAKALYQSCLEELHIRRKIPVYSNAFLKSPVMAGVIRPGIYLPIHLISDYQEKDLRYILLHELFHYRHRDSLIGHLMNLAGMVYWFHPLMRLSLHTMREDREIACDASVLSLLDEASYAEYGQTLIRFARKTSLHPFPFTAGLGENKKQIRKRILCIASYQKPTPFRRFKSGCAFFLICLLLSASVPFLSSDAAAENAALPENGASGTSSSLSTYFQGYEGCFVLYDMEADDWTIYNESLARSRVSPDSTYKIFDALFALEEGIITPEHNFLPQPDESYPFEEWNQDQTLQSAITSSVNWYFQNLDHQMGASVLRSYLHQIGYGNESLQGDLSSYWMESSLKISPVEQVQLLASFYYNDWNFDPSHIETVKDAICLSSSSGTALYGKTGTGQINGQNINGWFVGFVESSGYPVFFASNLRGKDAAGSAAASITLSILSDLGICSDESL